MGKRILGRVVSLPFGTNSWGIKGDDGSNYEPINLPDTMKQDGLRVCFEVIPTAESVSITMWGTPVKLGNPELIVE